MKLLNSIRFRIIRHLSLKALKSKESFDNNAIYLTFDDGPEPDITEFIINELRKYNYKATFFCCGKNCDKYPSLFNALKCEGHSIANHTYSHINGISNDSDYYINDVLKCEDLTQSHIFRPPWGGLTLELYLKLSKIYSIVLWDVASGDTLMQNFNLESAFSQLVHHTQNGKIILFHFCTKHAIETKQILPLYLKYLHDNKFLVKAL